MKIIIALVGPLLFLALSSCQSAYVESKTRLQSHQAQVVDVKLSLCPRIQAHESIIAKDRELAYQSYDVKLSPAQRQELLAIYKQLTIRRCKTKTPTAPIHDSYSYIGYLEFYDAAGKMIDSLDPKVNVYSDVEERTESGEYTYLPPQYELRMRQIYCDAINASDLLNERVQPSSLFKPAVSKWDIKTDHFAGVTLDS